MREIRQVLVRGCAICGCAALSACAPAPDADRGAPAVEEPVRAGDPELASSLQATIGEDTVRLALRVTNPASEPVALEFRTGQRFDFAVSTPEGEELWRWSDGRFFTQALGTVTLAGGETVEYTATWPVGGRTGRFVALGTVTARNRSIEQRVQFRVPAP